MTTLLSVLIAIPAAALTWHLAGSLMSRFSNTANAVLSEHRPHQIGFYVLALVIPFVVASHVIDGSCAQVLFCVIACILWLLAVIDHRHKLVPESLIFMLFLVCGMSTLFRQSGITNSQGFAAAVLVALLIGAVIQCVSLRARLVGSSPLANVVFGSGDTLVIISLATYSGMDILYCIFFAASTMGIFQLVGRGRSPARSRYFAFLPAVYVGFIGSSLMSYALARFDIDTFNSLTERILSYAQQRGA